MKFAVPGVLHTIATLVVVVYVFVQTVGDLGWWSWAENQNDSRGWWTNFFVFLSLLLLVATSSYLGWVAVSNRSMASKVYASAFY